MNQSLGMAFMEPQVAAQQIRESNQRMEMAELSKGATVRKHAAEAEGLELKNAEAKQLDGIFRNFKPKPGQTQSAALTEMAVLAAPVNPQLAQTMFHRASQAELAEARQVALDAQAAQRNSVAQKRIMENWNQLFGRVRTERELQSAKLYASTRPDISVDELKRIDAMTLQDVLDMGPRLLSAEKAADLAIREAAEKTKRFEAQSRDAKRKIDVDLAQQRIDAKAEKDAADEKAGGKDTGRPTAQDVKDARAWASTRPEFQALDGPESQRGLAADLAARTRKVHQRNPSKPMDVSRAEAWLELMQEKVIEDYTTMGGLGPNRTRYNPLGPNVKRAAGGAKPTSAAAPLVTATNPKTGEKLVLRNGKWEKP